MLFAPTDGLEDGISAILALRLNCPERGGGAALHTVEHGATTLKTSHRDPIAAVAAVLSVGAVGFVALPLLAIVLVFASYAAGMHTLGASIGNAQTWITGCLFPFIMAREYGKSVPLSAHPVAYSWAQWLLLAAANGILVRLGYSRRPVATALLIAGLSGLVAGGVVIVGSLDFLHLGT